jgi:single-stranded DNA-binding protein
MSNEIRVTGNVTSVGDRSYTVNGDCVAEVRVKEVIERKISGEMKTTNQHYKFTLRDEEIISDLEFCGKDTLISVRGSFQARFWTDEYKQKQVTLFIQDAVCKILQFQKNGETLDWAIYANEREKLIRGRLQELEAKAMARKKEAGPGDADLVSRYALRDDKQESDALSSSKFLDVMAESLGIK